MNRKRDDTSHWGWDVLCLVLIVALYFFKSYDALIEYKPRGYYKQGFDPLFPVMDLLLGKTLVYTFIVLMGSSFLFNAIIKIKKVTLKPLEGIRRILWIILRLVYLSVVFFLIKEHITGNISFFHKSDIILVASILPLITWIIIAKTKLNMWHFFVITLYIVVMYSLCLNRILLDKHVKAIGIIENIELKQTRSYNNYKIYITYDEHKGFINVNKHRNSSAIKYESLNVGDTITLIYSPIYLDLNKVVNFSPTAKEIENYK